MSAGVVIAIVIGAIVLIAVAALVAKKGRERRQEGKRHEARDVRRGAQISGAQADRQHAEADESAARARKQQAMAEEQSAEADKHSRFARERHEEADSIDPDADEDARREERAGETHRRGR